jgi:hypothetical protein
MGIIEAEEPSWVEHRRHARMDARLKATFRVLKEEGANCLTLGPEMAPRLGQGLATRDISEGGVGLAGELSLLGGRPLEQGLLLLVEIWPPEEPEPLLLRGRVAWCRPVGPAFSAGICFEDQGPATKEKLCQLLRRYSLGA